MTNVKKYTDRQLLNKIQSLESFSGFPNKDFLIGVRSSENAFNKYDDKFYHFNKELKCVNVLTGTTNSGSYGFKNYFKWNKKGVGQIKADECYYNVWKPGLHKKKMKALRQVGGFKIIRKTSPKDPNKNWNWEYNKGFNFHTNTYTIHQKRINWFINGWSVGCQVVNDAKDYYYTLDQLNNQDSVTYILLNEF